MQPLNKQQMSIGRCYEKYSGGGNHYAGDLGNKIGSPVYAIADFRQAPDAYLPKPDEDEASGSPDGDATGSPDGDAPPPDAPKDPEPPTDEPDDG